MNFNGRPSNIQLREDVLRELRHEPRTKARDIRVEASEGKIKLTGTVHSQSEVLAALEATRRVEGIFEVVNELKILPPAERPRTDQEIAKAVRHALEWDAMIPDRRVQSAVSNGWVALHGTVELLREREDAERLVRRLEGVRGVYNLIEVSSTTKTENVRELIEDALKRQAENEARSLEVSLQRGVINLSGKVHTWAEKQAIMCALVHVLGVEGIQDHLSVDPYF